MAGIRRNSILLFAIPFSVTLFFYLLTVCRTLYSGDSGEFAFIMHSLGIAHPPGYPLITLLGKFFVTFIPGNTALVLNILSSLLASSATGIGAFIIRNALFQGESRDEIRALFISISIACLWGFANDVWASAVGIEVYSLGMVLILLSLLCIQSFLETGDFKRILLSSYLLSLGMANHLTASALVLPILFVLIRSKAPWRIWAYSAALAVFGLTIYLYIPVRSLNDLISNWGDLSSPAAFFNHLTARRYQEYITGFRFENYIENFIRSLSLLASQFPLLLGFLGIIGMAISKRITTSFKIVVVMIIVFNFLTVALYDIPDIEQYYLPSYFLISLGLAAFLQWLFDRIDVARPNVSRGLAYTIPIILMVITIAFNFRNNDQSDNKLSYIYGMNILNCVPENSILISTGDNANSTVQYLHYVEGVRKDLEIYDPLKTTGLLRKKLKTESGAQGTGFELCMKIMMTYPQKSYLSKEHMLRRNSPFNYASLPLTPYGMVYRIGNYPVDPRIWNRLGIPKLDDLSNIDIKGLTMLCNLYLNRGEDRQRMGDSSLAYKDFMMASDIAFSSREAITHNSLGVFFRRHKVTGLAEQEYQKALNSRHLTADEEANIYVNLGNLRKDKSNFDEAIEYYNKAVQINGKNDEALYNLALTRAYIGVNRGRYRDAVAAFEDAVLLSVSDPRLFFNLGVLYDKNLNDTSKAIYNYRKFVEFTPQGTPESRSAFQRIEELSH